MYLEMVEQTIAKTPKWIFLTEGRPAPVEFWFPKDGGFWRWNIGEPGN